MKLAIILVLLRLNTLLFRLDPEVYKGTEEVRYQC